MIVTEECCAIRIDGEDGLSLAQAAIRASEWWHLRPDGAFELRHVTATCTREAKAGTVRLVDASGGDLCIPSPMPGVSGEKFKEGDTITLETFSVKYERPEPPK